MRSCRSTLSTGGAPRARTVSDLPCGTRLTDYISVGVLTQMVPPSSIDAVWRRTGKVSLRQRELPAPVMVYYVIALALCMQSDPGCQ